MRSEEIDVTTDDSKTALEELAPHLDLFDPEHSRQALEVLAYARDKCTLLKSDAGEGYYIAARYADVHTLALDTKTFSSIQANLRGIPIPMPPLTSDPPVQTEYRKQLNPYMSRSFLAQYEDDVRAIAVELLDAIVPTGRMEFIADFAVPLTARSLAKVILDHDDEELMERGAEANRRLCSESTPDAFVDLANVAEAVLTARSAEGSDRDDVLGAIARASVEGRPLTMAEQVGFTTALMSGGLDSTKATMGNIVLRMTANPALETRLRNPNWIKEGDLDEFLRLDTPVQFMARTVTADAVLGGCPVKAGDRIAIHFASANRDPREFENPDELVFDRPQNSHAAFGIGPHRCIGMHFARMELGVAFKELLARATNFRVPDGESVEMQTGVVFAPERLPLEFDVL